MKDILIRGGTVVDGAGEEPRRADVRVRAGRIDEVRVDIRPGDEDVIDAGEALVTPGFIDAHTHYDGPMWWMPTLDPLPAYGSTTAVMGNCGLSAAPMAESAVDKSDLIGIFSFLEDIPRRTFENEVPWTWRSWPEYREAMQRRPTAANVSALVGHLNLRISVMGGQAWKRNATPSEVAAMARLLEDSLRCGALGLSTNFFDKDGNERPVPSRLADRAEFEVLLDVLSRHPGVILQFITDIGNPAGIIDELRYVSDMCIPRKVRMQFLQMPMGRDQNDLRDGILEVMDDIHRVGGSIWTTYQVWPANVSLNFERTILFSALNLHAWDDLANKTEREAKLFKLRDPAWRARARAEWDSISRASFMRRKLFLNGSENQAGPLDLTLQEYADSQGLHPSDALAEWAGSNGVGSTVRVEPSRIDDKLVTRLLRHPHTLTAVNDAGAHCQVFCGGGASAYLLTHFVRDTSQVAIEEAVRSLTSQIAGHFSFSDRGLIAPGKIADLSVFSLGEMSFNPEVRVTDVPDGDGGTTWRFTRKPAPFRATIVGGAVTFRNDNYTGEMPGRLIGPGPAFA